MRQAYKRGKYTCNWQIKLLWKEAYKFYYYKMLDIIFLNSTQFHFQILKSKTCQAVWLFNYQQFRSVETHMMIL